MPPREGDFAWSEADVELLVGALGDSPTEKAAKTLLGALHNLNK